MWVIVQESALEEGRVDVFFFHVYGGWVGGDGGVLGEVKPHCMEGERNPGSVSRPVRGEVGGGCGGSDSATLP